MGQAFSMFRESPDTLSPRSVTDDEVTLNMLLTDPEFAVIVEVRLGFLSHTTQEYQTALDEIEKILADIDASIRE